MRSTPNARPIVFGEVLFDHFLDHRTVLGGAPFNVAWHLQGFGARPLFVSRVGDDREGATVRRRMSDWGLDLAGLQVDPLRPTGAVEVTFDDGEPGFNIVPDQAYDHIDAAAAMRAVQDISAALLYHGSLITRSPASRQALNQLRRLADLPAFVDVNLRPPWWTPALVKAALGGARWAKLNDDELRIVMDDDVESAADPEALRRTYRLDTVIVTRGAAGADVATAAGVTHGEPVPVPDLVDTVGAGDAFSAVMILALLEAWPVSTALARALGFASAICGMRGATGDSRALYDKHLQAWSAAPGD
jgi:fructokinase